MTEDEIAAMTDEEFSDYLANIPPPSRLHEPFSMRWRRNRLASSRLARTRDNAFQTYSPPYRPRKGYRVREHATQYWDCHYGRMTRSDHWRMKELLS